MLKKIKKYLFGLDSIIVSLSIIISLYSFCCSNLILLEKKDNYMLYSNNNRNFIISNSCDKIEIFDGCSKIREIQKPDNFSFEEFENKYNTFNCAFVAAVTAGAVLATAGAGLAAGLGLAETEIAGLFEMAAAGATVAEVWAAIVELVGFWAAVGFGLAAVG